MSADLSKAHVFGKNGISFDDEVYVFHSVEDPIISGFDAPPGSICIYLNGAGSKIYQKNGTGLYDWAASAGNTVNNELDKLVLHTDLSLLFTNSLETIIYG